MLAIVYLIISAIFGIALVNLAVPDVRRLFVAGALNKHTISLIPNTLFTVPAGILVGFMCTGFFNYFCILGLSYAFNDGTLCKRIGMVITFAILIWLTLSCLVLINRRRLARIEDGEEMDIEPYKYSFKDTMFYGIVIAVITAVTTFLMLYTYRITGGELSAGFSTFSDLAPHTAMVSSFSNGFNFPTQYMHFSGDGIQYHFMFYFFCGMLNYGGFPIDVALNVPSIITMVCALILLGLLAVLLSGKRGAFVFAPLLVFFRSSWNAFDHLLLLMKQESFLSALKDIAAFDSWYEVTPFDSWGIWAINVYPNQRHLMLGIGLIIMMIILFLPFVRRMCISCMRAGGFGKAIKAFLFSRSSWLPRSEDTLSPYYLTILAIVTVVVMPYFHGSALIAMLLILFGMAIFSESRLLHLIVAVCAVISSYIQTKVFSGGAENVVSFKFHPGFVLEDPGAMDVVKYILIVTGLTLVLGLLMALISFITDIKNKKPVYRFLMFLCFMLPMAFGFNCQISLEMLANHKFIQISLILADAFVAILLSNLFAIPYKIARKGSGSEEIAAAAMASSTASSGDVSSEPVVFNGELIPAEPVVNLADTGNASDDNDLPEEIELPEEIITDVKDDPIPDEEVVGIRPGNEIALLEESSSAEAGEEEAEDPEEETTEKVEIDDTTALEDLFDIVPAERKDTESVSSAVEEISLEEFFSEDDEDVEISAAPITEEPVEESVFTEEEESSPSEEPEEIGEPEEIAEPEETEEAPEAEEKAEEEVKPAAIAPAKKSSKEISLGKFIALQLAGIILGICLLVPLTATGISEWCTYYNLNKGRYTIDADSPVTRWIIENTEPSDVFLTPMWSLNSFYLAGRPSYYGWPYYAWSAGHDTDTRDQIYAWLISGCGGDINEFTRYCTERGIRYLLADPEFDIGEYAFNAQFNWEFFAENLTQVASFNENGAKIYKIY